MKILAIIPARSGSKGVPNKNIRLLADRPLLYYPYNLAKKCKEIDQVAISTESKKIEKVAKGFNCKIYFLRPKYLATDSASTIDVINHALKTMERIFCQNFEVLVLLQPTTPFTMLESLKEAIKKIKTQKVNSVISLVEANLTSPDFNYKLKGKKAVCHTKKIYKSRHEIPKNYLHTGNFYIFKKKFFLKTKRIVDKKNTGYVVLKQEEHLNIDSMRDWKIATLLAKKNYDSKKIN